MTARERLPNRRRSEVFDFVCPGDGLRYTATLSFYGDGRPAEVFVGNHKSGSHVDNAAKDAAILASLALQYGAPVAVLRGALLRDHLGRAVTPVAAALDAIDEADGRG
jgi:ribonucleoside-diphosphate reductase alpha chain